MPGVGVPTRASGRVENDLAFHHRQGFVVALASFRLERAFIVEVSPRVVTANLVGSAGNTGNVAAIGKLQFELRLLLDRFLERDGFLQPRRLGFVETLGVLYQLNDFVHFWVWKRTPRKGVFIACR